MTHFHSTSRKTKLHWQPMAKAPPFPSLQDVGVLISLTVTCDAWSSSIFWTICVSCTLFQERVHLDHTNVDIRPANERQDQHQNSSHLRNESWSGCGLITCYNMMTSSNGNIFRVTGHLCGEFTGPRWIPRTKASDAELWCFLWSASE